MQRTIYREDTREVTRKKSLPYLFWKRFFDIGTSLLLIIICMPLIVVFAIASYISSGRPILFSQTRTGLNNKPFTIWKFRTMNVDMNQEKKHIYDWTDKVPDDFFFKTGNNCEVTRIGRIYRKYSIDELPQLFNVLLGDMSIVGPRPEIPEITNCYNKYQFKRLESKPGITGFAQINGRSEINHGEKIELDRYYIENSSLLIDLKIVVRTLFLVIKGNGAY